MDKPMNEYAADAPRVLRDFLTYISTIRGKSAKTAHEYYLDLRLFFRVLKHNKGAVDKNLPLDEIEENGKQLDAAPHERLAQKILAREVVTLVHGEKAYKEALNITEQLFAGNIKNLSV